jgi:hypothetical protein
MPEPSRRKRVVVLGIMGQMPFAGMAWQVLQYLEGFRRLGWCVYYVEDTGQWPYDPQRQTVTDDPAGAVGYIRQIMDWVGLPEQWAYRSGVDGRIFGLTDSGLAAVLASADVLLNVCGATVLHDEHLAVPARIYLETDPVLPEIEVARGVPFTVSLLSAHTHHFTYGENLGERDCVIPAGPFRYHVTRPPVVVDWWCTKLRPAEGAPFTTVAHWKQTGKDVEWNGELYKWSKDVEFRKFLDLPRRRAEPFELALSGIDGKGRDELRSHGWRIADAMHVSRGIETYRDYVRAARGEFTVAKDQYVRMRSGWFSDRSVCYLAAGRPVITQETGFSKFVPTGRGLFSFGSLDEILDAVERVASDYDAHSAAAREIAAEYFAADKVIGRLLDQAGL